MFFPSISFQHVTFCTVCMSDQWNICTTVCDCGGNYRYPVLHVTPIHFHGINFFLSKCHFLTFLCQFWTLWLLTWLHLEELPTSAAIKPSVTELIETLILAVWYLGQNIGLLSANLAYGWHPVWHSLWWGTWLSTQWNLQCVLE